MDIVVASRNPVKIEAVERAFSRQFPSQALNVVAVNIDSGVSDQPVGDEETRRGATNRVERSSRSNPGADFWVGLEGGVAEFDGHLSTFAWIVVQGRNGKSGAARTATLPLPPQIKELVDAGLELGEANDRVFLTVNSKQGSGAFGLLTDGRYTRTDIYAQTVTIALIPLVHELW